MKSVRQGQRFVRGNPLQKKRIKRCSIFRGKIRVNLIESALIVFAKARRSLHSRDQDFDFARGEPIHDLREHFSGLVRVQPAQHVIGAELQDHAIRPVGQGPIEACETVGRCVAGNASVDDRDIIAGLPQSFFENRGKALIGRQEVARREAVAEGDKF
jgi:hypothetical protein